MADNFKGAAESCSVFALTHQIYKSILRFRKKSYP